MAKLSFCSKKPFLPCFRQAFLAAGLVLLLWLSPSQSAQAAVDQAFQWWAPVYVDFPILNSKIRGFAAFQLGFNEGMKGVNQYFLRTAIGYRFRKHLEAYAGYAYVNDYQPSRVQENRVYQQFGVGQVMFKRIQVLHRLRTEQRFFNNREGCAVRMRYLLRFATPIPSTRWYVVTSDELFVNLNSLNDGPDAGIDQNRLYAGLGRQVNRKLRLETGYQYQHVNNTDPDADKASHQLITQAFISL